MRLASLIIPLALWAGIACADQHEVLTLSHAGESRTLGLEEIERTEMHELELQHPEGPSGRFAGVWLNDFLAAHRLDEARRVRFIAHDDYTTFLTPAERRQKDYLLLTRLDGEPIPRRELGPLMLVVPDDLDAVQSGIEPMTRWIWAIREISAR
ncbi:molybdopterin-dependent oxidoreductase [Halomonas urumqiensis]|uniref:Oxidoreductase molybdopterin-binding domain-containing protein n=1 Tax=Halomonas urumqiensis TaxID=1684789 RepID=A0A2N7UNA1_9GAMM|nr:molybdopterin-dependent oxidoreductase [Halomonas urumqiensis]PMR81907.1 hypothetical protein C1H70_03575 [Halomonas urumqiensis]PTB03988.1 hypothetical protein C6V82_05915 [Halomonas urumqiensis]